MARQKSGGYKSKLESRPFTESPRVSLVIPIKQTFGNHELSDFDLDKFRIIFNRIASKAIKKMEKI